MGYINFDIGNKVLYNNNVVLIAKILDSETIMVRDALLGTIHTIKIHEIQDVNQTQRNETLFANDSQISKKAIDRYNIIAPIIEGKSKSYKQVADESGKGIATIYRWTRKFLAKGSISALIPEIIDGGRRQSRLNPEVEKIVQFYLNTHFLHPKKESIAKTIIRIQGDCHSKNLSLPSESTIRRRISWLSNYEITVAREGKRKAKDAFDKHGNSLIADYPLSLVQMDHTELDIMCVDEKFHKPFKRPWLTVAIDVYSRAILGFYLSFDPPGTFAAGRCIANSILTKQDILNEYEIDAVWPFYGVMDTLHMDNAKEFHGNTLKMAALLYGFNIDFRRGYHPKDGAHIERLCGTLNTELHNLPGTTYSNPILRTDYSKKKQGVMTITDLEKWILIFILKIYHVRIHNGIGMSPIQRYNEGITGNSERIGTGLPPKINDARNVKLNFMPFISRTVQQYGIKINHIEYYDEVLKKYINSKEPGFNNRKRKFIFRTDPRDLSKVYFYEPDLKEYFEIPYKDVTRAPMSRWTFEEIRRKLKENTILPSQENIFKAHRELDSIVIASETKTKTLNKKSRVADSRNSKVHKEFEKKIPDKVDKEDDSTLNYNNLKPFTDIDYGAL